MSRKFDRHPGDRSITLEEYKLREALGAPIPFRQSARLVEPHPFVSVEDRVDMVAACGVVPSVSELLLGVAR